MRKVTEGDVLGDLFSIAFNSTSTSCSACVSFVSSFPSTCCPSLTPAASFPVFMSHFSPPLTFNRPATFFPVASEPPAPTIGTSFSLSTAAGVGFGDLASAAFFAAASASRNRCPTSTFSASLAVAALASMALTVEV